MTKNQRRKLDAWIAKHVIPLPRNDERVVFHQGSASYLRGGEFVDSVPFFTSDAASAMRVLQCCGAKMAHGTQFVCLNYTPPGESTFSKKGHWNVGRIKDGHWDSDPGIGQADTLELAICLFAQKLYANQNP